MDDTQTKQERKANYFNDGLGRISDYLLILMYLLNLSILIKEFWFINNSLKSKNMDIINNIIAPLLVGLLTAGFGWLWSLRKIKKKIDAAPRKYVQELDDLITRAIAEGEERAILNARAIVSARNSLRGSLITISQHLNSEIDRLARDIGETVQTPQEPSKPNPDAANLEPKKAYETIIVLSKIWPAKKTQIEYEIRKLLAELGLL